MTSFRQDGPKQLSSSRSSILRERSDDVASGSFRVYYSHGAGTVPFVWETIPGTPKSAAVHPATVAAADDEPPPTTTIISLPPSSYHGQTMSETINKKKCTRPRGWMPGMLVMIRKWLTSCVVPAVHRSS